MKHLLLPIGLAVVGLAGGIGAGLALKPPAPAEDTEAEVAAVPLPPATPSAFVEMANPFVIPLIGPNRIRSMVVLELSLEVAQAEVSAVRALEPRLRDAFLRVLFDHANAGGFDGVFTAASPMSSLRTALRETATSLAGPGVRDVLILDMMRQD
ncbi:MAG: flagellar basal body-associated FliL family protein [Alkalilacustris sp.]